MSVSLAKGTKKIGNYQLGDVIGKGAMGFVSKGLNLETGTYVAIKQVALQNIKEDQLKSIQSEINLLKRLKHPNIVKYIDYIRTDTHLNIVLEFVETGSLAYIIKRFGPFPEGLVAVYIKQVLIGLDYLHKQGVVHRDIKGANILTTKDGVVKLADFGVATRLTELTEVENSYSVVGTPYWMAPEIIEMRGHVSTSCDIWSVGCTVIELINANPPYYPMQPYTAMWRIVHDDHPPLPDGISPDCREFLLACFEKDPMHRIDAAGLLQHRWIRSQNQREVYDIINSPNNELPEEVHNTIRLHIDDKPDRRDNILTQPDLEQEGVFNPNNNIVNIMEGSEVMREERHEKEKNESIHHSQKKESILLYENLHARQQEADLKSFHENRYQDPSYSHNSAYYPQSMSRVQENQSQIQSKGNPAQNPHAGANYFGHGGQDFRAEWANQHHPRGGYAAEDSANFPASAEKKPMQSNMGTIIYEEGSFVSVDQNLENHGSNTLYLMGGSTVQMNSRMRRKEGGWGPGDGALRSQKECKIYKDLNEIMESITNLSDQEDIEGISRLLQDLTNLLKSYSKDHHYHHYIIQQYGFTIFLDIIEQFDEHINSNTITHAVICLINLIIDSDKRLLDEACLFGVLPYFLKFSVSEYPRDIRMEAIYFIGKMFYSTRENMRVLIASGGLSVLAEFLDTNYKDNKEFVSLGLDCLSIIINDYNILSSLNMWKMLCRYHILQRLILVIDQIHTDQDPSMEKYLFKALDLLANYAKCEDRKMRTMLCEEDSLQMLKIMLTTFTSKEDLVYLRKMIKIFRFIATEPTVLNALENSGILPIVLNLIRLFITKPLVENEETLQDLIKIVFYMIKLNAPRQEQLVLCGGINILTYICKNTNKTLRKCSLPILCYFVQTSSISRSKLWEAGGPRIYIDNLDDETYQAKLLDTLAVWLEWDLDRVEAILIDPHIFPKLIDLFRKANKANFEQIVPIYLKFISQSEKLGRKLGKTDEFLQELVERLGVDSLENHSHLQNEHGEGEYGKFLKGNPNAAISLSNFSVSSQKKPLRPECSNPSALVRKEILDILLNLCLKHSDPRSLLNKHSLYPIIVKILHIAENENMVILEEISTQLLQIYSGESPLKNNKFPLAYMNVGEFAY